ncbi:MAG: cellulose biosynthesis cyclic di-GMP-binding regulatory protein BcsB [Oceanicaulis sp.]|nr:cellulose biosynthesis cyclic di-GMP-binding regulatory protein BcsB [Oceanicaulis sp.]
MKSNHEDKRRFPWFSASLGIIAVVSVVTLFVSGQLNAGQGDFGTFVTRTAERLTNAQAVIGVEGRHRIRFEDAGADTGVVVSGFPSFAHLTLPLVRDQRPRAVRLVLTGEQDVGPDTVTALQVTVNGKRVMERRLTPGLRNFNWVFDLTNELAGASNARVAFQLTGDLPDDLCHNERSMGAMVAFSAGSGIEVDLDGPLTSVRDVMALTPRRVTIAMEEGDAWFQLAVRLGSRLARNGYSIDMIDLATAAERVQPGERGLVLAASPEALRRAGFTPVRERAPTGAGLFRRAGATMVAVMDAERFETVDFLTSEMASIARSDVIDAVLFEDLSPDAAMTPLTAFGADTSVQNIANSRTWRMEYSLADLPGGRLPEAVALDLRLPVGPDGVTNLVHTFLNGEMIDSRRLQPGNGNSFAVGLPPHLQTMTNQLAITLQRHRDTGGCEISQQRFPVQLSSESGLMLARGDGAAGFTLLPPAFADGLLVRLPTEMEGPERLVTARVTAEAIARFAPRRAELSFEFALVDNGASARITRPYLAINNMPSNAEAPLRVYADRLVMDSRSYAADADVRALSDLTLLQVSRARVNPDAPSGEPPAYVLGLVVHAIDAAPSMLGATLGQEIVTIVHADGEAVAPRNASVSGIAATLPRS